MGIGENLWIGSGTVRTKRLGPVREEDVSLRGYVTLGLWCNAAA